MKKEMRKSSVKGATKVVISVALVIAMLFSLCACGKDDKPSDNREPVTSVSELPKDGLGVDEPGQEIDPGFEAPTTTTTTEQQNNGSYSYTIYEGFTVTMDVDINDYVITTEYGTFFQIYNLATDLGWVGSDYPGQPESTPRYELANGDMTTLFSFEAFDEVADGTNGGHQVSYFSVEFVQTNDFATYYYQNDSNVAHNNATVHLDPHYEIDDYRLDGKGYYLSHDDVVLIAYILWACAENPGVDPLDGIGISNVAHRTNSNGYDLH